MNDVKYNCNQDKSLNTDLKYWSASRICFSCGDGIKHSSETCDDKNQVDSDGCSSDCQ